MEGSAELAAQRRLRRTAEHISGDRSAIGRASRPQSTDAAGLAAAALPVHLVAGTSAVGFGLLLKLLADKRWWSSTSASSRRLLLEQAQESLPKQTIEQSVAKLDALHCSHELYDLAIGHTDAARRQMVGVPRRVEGLGSYDQRMVVRMMSDKETDGRVVCVE